MKTLQLLSAGPRRQASARTSAESDEACQRKTKDRADSVCVCVTIFLECVFLLGNKSQLSCFHFSFWCFIVMQIKEHSGQNKESLHWNLRLSLFFFFRLWQESIALYSCEFTKPKILNTSVHEKLLKSRHQFGILTCFLMSGLFTAVVYRLSTSIFWRTWQAWVCGTTTWSWSWLHTTALCRWVTLADCIWSVFFCVFFCFCFFLWIGDHHRSHLISEMRCYAREGLGTEMFDVEFAIMLGEKMATEQNEWWFCCC